MSKRRRPTALRAARTGVASAVAPEARGDGPANKLAATPPRGPRRAVLFALFAASGFAGLIYESVWTHYLKLFLGHAAYAQALVLAIFMGGMAVGAWLASRWSPAWRNPLVAYAAIEAAIGLCALVFHQVFTASIALAWDVVLPRLAGSGAAGAFKWTLSVVLVLPQSVLLGMTFPLMAAGVLRSFSDRPGRSLALLYFTNSLGAAAGVLVSGFVLIPLAGLPGTIRAAGLVNLAVAALVYRQSRGGAAPAPAAASASRDGALFAFLAVSLITGASSFIYEVSWIRMLSMVLGASTHSFELMLSAFILGLALGGLWIQRRIDGLQRPVRALALLQWAMGLFALATLLVYGQAFPVMAWLVQHLPRNDGGWALFNLSSNGIALAIMLPATFCAGTTLPLITHRLLQSGHGEASIGAVYAANTLGAIAAVFFSIHLGMPILGLKGLLILGAALDILVGVALLWSAASGFATRRWPLALGTAAVLAVALAGFVPLDPVQMASGVYSPGRSHASGKLESLFHRDGKTATVSVVRDEGGILSIRTNGKSDAALTPTLAEVPSPDEPTMVLLGALPMTLRPQARNVACIGFGAGLTTQTLLSNPTLERVDTIEIEPEMVRGAELFRPRNELAYTDPRSHVVIEDAKTFFSTQSRKYDLIISEPSNPWVSGVAGLFSDEFYRLMRPHLAPGGLFVQWLQLYELDVPLALSVLKALEANFDDYAVYAANDSDLIIAASNGGLVGQPDPSVLMVKDLATAMVRVGLRNLQDLELRRVGTRKSWEGLTRSVSMRMNSDYAPVLDEGAARARFLDLDARPLQDFEKSVFPAVELLSGVSREGATTEVSDAGTFYFDGNRRAHEAMWLRDLLLGRAGVEERVVSSDELHGHARQVSEWLDACGDRPLPLASLLRVLQTAVPDLTVGDLDEIWWRLASSGCMRQLSGQASNWIGLLQAIGRRDGARMAATARMLLEAEPNLTPASRRYLVAAGMLGAIAHGDPVAAHEIWTSFGGTLPDDLLIRMLVMRSGE